MTSNRKTKKIILITLGIYFTFPLIFINSFNLKGSEFNNSFNLENENLKISKISGKIHIDNNWTDSKDAEICTGNGTYSEPYVIEDLVIDGNYSGSCIFIENSDVYFKIENCTLYNAGGFKGGDSAGILLINVNNSQLINNNCSSNVIGLHLKYSNNNTISENIVNYNSWIGIRVAYSEDNIFTGNIVNNNTNFGIHTFCCFSNNISINFLKNNNIVGIYSYACSYNTISGNIANNSIHGIFLAFDIYNIISGNMVDNNSYGIYLMETNSTIILENMVVNNSYGLFIKQSIYNTISGNTANNNSYAIYLERSDYNIISGNTLLGNEQCIVEKNCQGNEFSDNDSCPYGEGDEKLFISGYHLLLLLGLLSVISILIYFIILIFKKS